MRLQCQENNTIKFSERATRRPTASRSALMDSPLSRARTTTRKDAEICGIMYFFLILEGPELDCVSLMKRSTESSKLFFVTAVFLKTALSAFQLKISVFDCERGVQRRLVNSQKYGVDLARFTHAKNACVHASTKVDDDIRQENMSASSESLP